VSAETAVFNKAATATRIASRWPSGSGVPSTRPGIWSRAAKDRRMISGVIFNLPERTCSKKVSKLWMNPASSEKPNIAPLPLTVCRSRNT
jgi:hypothetical protein